MHYVSTRQAPDNPTRVAFKDVLLAGLAPDGGLYVPESWPHYSKDELRRWRGLDYPELALRVVSPFLGGAFTEVEFLNIARATYADFDHKAVAPLKQLGTQEFLLELFHGPTLAFKDYALQLLGRLFDAALARDRERLTIVGATSGDTGSAAISAFSGRGNIDIYILYPDGRTSEVQRRQMTSVNASNVHTLAVAGTFDDCQDLVKAMFADAQFRQRHRLSAVNSINWGRIAAQIVYYFAAALELGTPDVEIVFSVPTGNFGNVYAAHAARAMGLPISSLIIGTNRNDILFRYIETGQMTIEEVQPSYSPSMDIQISSNFERLLYEVSGRNGATIAARMNAFRARQSLPEDEGAWRKTRDLFQAARVDDAGTFETIRTLYRETGELLDPHSAVAVAAMRTRRTRRDIPHVALACAHPAKFPEVVAQATGQHPQLPPHLSDLMSRPERINRIGNDLGAVQDFIDRHSPRTLS